MMQRAITAWLASVLMLVCACSGNRAQQAEAPGRSTRTASASPMTGVPTPEIDPGELRRHIEILSADGFEGRAPGTPGEERTLAYLEEQFRALGLAPGNPDGTYVQKVPLIGFRNQAEMSVEVAGKPLPISLPDEAVLDSRRFVDELAVDRAELVFAGYGVEAPEYGWNDFEGLDVRGKTLIVLVNDPPVRDPRHPAALDQTMFKGPAMTYYGRWTYKYEVASAKGAAAVLIVHEDEPAGYPYAVVSQGWGQEDFDIDTADGNRARVPFEGWMTRGTAERLFAAAGLDFESLKQAAARPGFRAVPLAATASFHNRQVRRQVDSHNVLARLPGRDPKVQDEAVIYLAHWDHLGRDTSLTGDQIYNGALDNASGVASVLALAHAFTAQPAPRRSILFMLTTAEERGLLGSRYYASHPLYPLEKTLAAINIDGVNPWGPTRDVSVVGYGMSTLDDLVAAAAGARNRTVTPDTEPEKGFYFRSDHFPFARLGVPAMYLDPGIEFVGKSASFATKKRKEYVDNHYHQVSDELDASWDLTGAAEDLELMFQVGYAIASRDAWPAWKPGSEFEATRREMLERAR
jgi:Zn-dependent M28 family amino/carboxypeptidase